MQANSQPESAPPITDAIAGTRLDGARQRAEAAYVGLRRFLNAADAKALDMRWMSLLAGLTAFPALTRLNALTDFREDMHRQIAEREAQVLESTIAANAVAAERHSHSLDGVAIGAPYVADRDFTQFIDGITLSCRKGTVLKDHVLIAKLLALGAPLALAVDDGDPVVACKACGHEYRRSEGSVRGRAA
jgi:hypothetical protein